MLLPTDGTVLLNAGTMSPTPRAVMKAAEVIRLEQASNPHKFFFDSHGRYIRTARQSLAKFLRVEADDLFLFPNVTISLNHIAHAMDCAVREGKVKRDTVLVSSLEYGSIALTWRNATREASPAASLRVDVVEIDACATWDEMIAAFKKKMNRRTLAVCMSHVAQPTGRVLPVKALAALARERGIFSVIDGAHATGNLDVDLSTLGVDAYGTNLHKWMMGLANAGFLHVSKPMKELLRPLFVSWGAKELRVDNRDTQAPFFGGTQLQGALEFWGCVDRVPQMVIPETLAFHRKVGFARIQARMEELQMYLTDRIGPMFQPVRFDDPEQQHALSAFQLGEIDRLAFWKWIWKRKIAIGATRIREDLTEATSRESAHRLSYLRISTGWFTTEVEIDMLERACRTWLKIRSSPK